jgi:hypothetical protein
MGTSYGSVRIEFPGLKAMNFTTHDGMLPLAEPSWRPRRAMRLPRRSHEFADGTRRRLSRKERGRLLTLAKKWNKHRHYDREKRTFVYLFKTTHRDEY